MEGLEPLTREDIRNIEKYGPGEQVEKEFWAVALLGDLYLIRSFSGNTRVHDWQKMDGYVDAMFPGSESLSRHRYLDNLVPMLSNNHEFYFSGVSFKKELDH